LRCGPDPMSRLLPLGFKVEQVTDYIEKKTLYQNGLYLDGLKDACNWRHSTVQDSTVLRETVQCCSVCGSELLQ